MHVEHGQLAAQEELARAVQAAGQNNYNKYTSEHGTPVGDRTPEGWRFEGKPYSTSQHMTTNASLTN